MRVAILDQTHDTRMFEDVSSRVWDPSQLCSEFNWQQPKKGDNVECVGLGLPIDLLRQRDYVAFDSLVVKLTVYLDPWSLYVIKKMLFYGDLDSLVFQEDGFFSSSILKGW